MEKINDYLKKLNWFEFIIIMIIFMGGTFTNKYIHTFYEWFFVVMIIGLPISIIALFETRN